MEAVGWIVGIAFAALVVWLFVKSMKREMAKPDKPEGEWGDLNSSRGDSSGDWGSRD